MPLNPPPTIQAQLGLVTQQFIRSDMSRAAEVTFGLACTGTPSLTVAQDSIDDFQAAFNAGLAGQFDSEVTILQPTIRLGDGSTTPFEAVAAGSPASGTNATTFPPPQVATLVKKSTGVGGKKNRGRSYFPFLTASSAISENGTINNTQLGIINGILATFLAQLVTDQIAMVIVNKTFNTPHPPHFVTAVTGGPAVTSYICEPLVATQRRRLGR
jgi:hypothetical protein